jgi:Phage portal protein/Bacterial CdiA-CT RNAse A domain
VAIDIHNTASAWNKALLDNSARPSGALVYSAANGQMTQDQFARLKSELETSFQGAAHAGRPLLLEGGLDWKPLSMTPKDMDFIEAKNSAAREIALAIGVPPMLLGIPGDATYSNYAEAQRAFWRNSVLPIVNRMALGFSKWLSPAFNAELELKPDLDQVEALAPEREALWTRLEGASFLTDDEKRAAAGYAAKDQGLAALATTAKFNPNHDDAGRFTTADGGLTGPGHGLGGTGKPSASNIDGRVRVAQTQDKPTVTNYKIDLQEEVSLGGHTIASHVARPDQELLDNVRRERVDILGTVTIYRKSQGSFLSIEDANNFVNRVLENSPERVQQVASGRIKDDAIIQRFGYQTGKEAFRPSANVEPFIRPTYEVLVRIQTDQRSPKGFRVFSAFPINAKKLLSK